MATGMFSDYLAGKVFDHVDGVASFTAPTQINIGLYTARGTIAQACAGTNFTEVSGGGYARVNIGVGGTNWNTAAARAMDNKLAVAMGTPSADWGTVTGYFVYDQGANLLWWNDLTTARSCPSGAAVSFIAGAIDLALPQGT
jgi:hypothetical protein